MKNNRRMEHGNVSKDFSLELTYNHKFKNGEAEVTKHASLSTGWQGTELSLGQILDFQKDVEKIFRQIKRIAEKDVNDRFFVSLIISAHEDVPCAKSDSDDFIGGVHQLAFDFWRFEGHGRDVDGGFYLKPDERYTEADRSVYISLEKKDGTLFEQLAGQEWACWGSD